MGALQIIVIIGLVIAGWWFGLKMIGGWPRERRVRIHGIEGMTLAQVQQEVDRGGRFVQFTVAVSLFIGIAGYWRRSESDIHFLKAGESITNLLVRYTVGMALLLPLGPLLAVALLLSDNRGKKTDVTYKVLSQLTNPDQVGNDAAKAAANFEIIKKYLQQKSGKKN
jgi:hypothetical protein